MEEMMTEKIKAEIEKTSKKIISAMYASDMKITDRLSKLLTDFAEMVLKSQWTVGENPPESGYYLAKKRESGWVDRQFYNSFMHRWCGEYGFIIDVTAWMPLPQPPKDE
jgi:hypothetical protein